MFDIQACTFFLYELPAAAEALLNRLLSCSLADDLATPLVALDKCATDEFCSSWQYVPAISRLESQKPFRLEYDKERLAFRLASSTYELPCATEALRPCSNANRLPLL